MRRIKLAFIMSCAVVVATPCRRGRDRGRFARSTRSPSIRTARPSPASSGSICRAGDSALLRARLSARRSIRPRCASKARAARASSSARSTRGRRAPSVRRSRRSSRTAHRSAARRARGARRQDRRGDGAQKKFAERFAESVAGRPRREGRGAPALRMARRIRGDRRGDRGRRQRRSARPSSSSATSIASLRGSRPSATPTRRARWRSASTSRRTCAGAATFRVTYTVRGARWAPLYDARLDTGGEDRKPSLELVRRAEIVQTDRRGLDRRRARGLDRAHRQGRQRAGAARR